MYLRSIGRHFTQMNAYFLAMNSKRCNWYSSEVTVLTEKVEEKLDLIRSEFSDIAIASQTQRRMLRGWR